MTVLYKSDLTTLSGSKIVSKLDPLAASMLSASRNMGNFATYSNRRLKGAGYDAIRTHLEYLSTAFQKLAQFDINVADNISHYSSSLASWMDEYSKLDDSIIEHLGSGLNYTGRRIGELDWTINHNKDLTSDEISYLYSCKSYYEDEYNKLLKEYNKLKELKEKDSTTAAVLDNIEADLSSFRSGLYGYKTTGRE